MLYQFWFWSLFHGVGQFVDHGKSQSQPLNLQALGDQNQLLCQKQLMEIPCCLCNDCKLLLDTCSISYKQRQPILCNLQKVIIIQAMMSLSSWVVWYLINSSLMPYISLINMWKKEQFWDVKILVSLWRVGKGAWCDSTFDTPNMSSSALQHTSNVYFGIPTLSSQRGRQGHQLLLEANEVMRENKCVFIQWGEDTLFTNSTHICYQTNNHMHWQRGHHSFIGEQLT